MSPDTQLILDNRAITIKKYAFSCKHCGLILFADGIDMSIWLVEHCPKLLLEKEKE